MNSCINRFGALAGLVKKVKRTGWTRYLPSEKVESVGDHSAKIAFLTLYLRNIENLDYMKCLQMALIHDIAEGLVGDYTPYCKITYFQLYSAKRKSFSKSIKQSYKYSKNWANKTRSITRGYGSSTRRERRSKQKLSRI